RPPPASIRGVRTSTWPFVLAMALAMAAVAALAYWDEQREFEAALDDFAYAEASLAASLAAELSTRLAMARRDALHLSRVPKADAAAAALLDGYAGFSLRDTGSPSRADPSGAVDVRVPVSERSTVDLLAPAATLLDGAMRLEQPGETRVLLLAPDVGAFRTSDGGVLESPPIRDGLLRGASSLWLDRDDAAQLGLARRRAAVGLARVDAGALGRYGVAVVSSAERERDRELRAVLRLVLSTLIVGGIVLGFGAFGLRKHAHELALTRELVLAEARRQRDVRLEAASRVATLGTLAMGIAHEVSTPLGVIAGRAEQLAARVGGDERSSRAVAAITAEAERIRRVVRGFLDLARGDAPALGRAEPASVLRAAVGMVEHRFTGAGVSIEMEIEPESPSIHCDAAMLEQALVNLLLNACDASPRGGAVTASLHADGERVAFVVRDAGSGIPPEIAARVTEPFFTTKPEGKGTGLGLAIASEIVKLHHGELTLRPAEPRGTSAALVLPVRGTVRDAA
ncbi:MAG TPA: HAMP domain-containing sensor histidine kinase, partial [Minicystis sp.]|nr:HAMP domain-containing sensor histidine kinase [Minicystis sp.]